MSTTQRKLFKTTSSRLVRTQNTLFVLLFLGRTFSVEGRQKSIDRKEIQAKKRFFYFSFATDVRIEGAASLDLNRDTGSLPPPKEGSFKAVYEIYQTSLLGTCLPGPSGFPRW